MTDLTPREIVSELDRFIIGQRDAKRAVSVALRSRWRRKQLSADLRDEVYPKNILMIGPTGVGKTEISRRLAKLARAPFIKVEATKFTEVGYVGRDVEQIIRDLVDSAIVMIRNQMRDDVRANAIQAAEDRVLDAIAGPDARPATRDMFRKKLRAGELDNTEIEIDVSDASNPMSMFDIPGQPGSQMGMMNLGDIFGKALGGRTVRRKMSVAESYEILISEEADKLLDDETVTKAALEAVEQNGIVFLDEIDKVCARAEARGGDVSREQALAWLADALKVAGQTAAKYDVSFIYEPLNRYETNLINELAEGARYLEEHQLENIVLLADLFHMNIEESDVAEAIRAQRHLRRCAR